MVADVHAEQSVGAPSELTTTSGMPTEESSGAPDAPTGLPIDVQTGASADAPTDVLTDVLTLAECQMGASHCGSASRCT